jgi:hypothetical protein
MNIIDNLFFIYWRKRLVIHDRKPSARSCVIERWKGLRRLLPEPTPPPRLWASVRARPRSDTFTLTPLLSTSIKRGDFYLAENRTLLFGVDILVSGDRNVKAPGLLSHDSEIRCSGMLIGRRSAPEPGRRTFKVRNPRPPLYRSIVQIHPVLESLLVLPPGGNPASQ